MFEITFWLMRLDLISGQVVLCDAQNKSAWKTMKVKTAFLFENHYIGLTVDLEKDGGVKVSTAIRTYYWDRPDPSWEYRFFETTYWAGLEKAVRDVEKEAPKLSFAFDVDSLEPLFKADAVEPTTQGIGTMQYFVSVPILSESKFKQLLTNFSID